MQRRSQMSLTLSALVLCGVVYPGFAGDEDKKPPAPRNYQSVAARVDGYVAVRLKSEGIPASPQADDAEFVRRIHLDLTGVVPTAEQAATFLNSQEPNKRSQLINDLLPSQRYGQHQADVWQALLVSKTSDTRRVPIEPLVKWLEAGFSANRPWDEMVRELLTATGTQEDNGATTFWMTNPMVDQATDTVSQLFLGVQLQCAQCHNHPFTEWKQEEYWGMAQFFTKVRLNGNPKNAAKKGIELSVEEGGKGRAPRLPESAKKVPPRFFQGEEPKLDKNDPHRPALAAWLTAPSNPFFAKAMVNRTWAKFFGRGVVNPIDDVCDVNPPSHPEVIDLLTQEFIDSGFDLQHLMRCICNTETYQRTSKPVAGNEKDLALFSHLAIRPLTPEQLFDSLEQVVGRNAPEEQRRNRKQMAQAAAKGQPNNARQQFIAFYGIDENAKPTEYQAGIPQALRLMNAPQINNAPVITQLAKSGHKPEQVVEQLYLMTLSRRPSPEALARMTRHVAEAGKDVRKGYADVLWVLLNTSEFALNH